MAKKKASSKKAPRKESGNALGWIIAAVVVIVILYLVMRGGNQSASQTAPTAPSEAGAGKLIQSEAPAFDKKCTIAIGIVPGTKTIKDNVVTVSFKNNGRVAQEGAYFAFTDASGKVSYQKNSDTVAPGASIAYTVDLNQVATQVGAAVKSFIVYPVQGGKACENQRGIVIDYS